VIGAAGISVLGFSVFDWTLGGTEERMAKERAEATVVEVLTPICVEKFHAQADASAKLTEFKKASTWDRRLSIENGGWATVPADHSLYRAENQYGNAISSAGTMAQSVIPQLRCLQWHCQVQNVYTSELSPNLGLWEEWGMC